MLRAHQLRCAALIGGYARTAEAQALVRSGWAHDLVAHPAGRADPVAARGRARGQRLRAGARPRRAHRPAAVDGAAGRADGAGGRTSGAGSGAAARLRARAGLRPLPHHRPLQALHRPAVAAGPGRRGRRCAGGAAATNRRCAARDAGPTPCAPSSSAPAAPPRNSAGRFPAPPSSPPAATRWSPRCPATRPSSSRHPGAEPVGRGRLRRGAAPRRAGRCSAARICARPRTPCAAGWRRPRWCGRGDGGVVAVVAESAIPTVQALIRWDPVGHAEAELDARAEVGLPPAVHMAAVDGAPEAVARAARHRRNCPTPPTLLGPVDLPPGARRPPGDAGRRPGQPDAGAGAPRRRAWRWRRRCGGPPGCSARGTISSPFVCKSTRCT